MCTAYYSCSRASLLPFRVVNHGGLTLYSAGPLSSYDSTKDTASTALGTVAAPSVEITSPCFLVGLAIKAGGSALEGSPPLY
jgi:hypothetical protein